MKLLIPIVAVLVAILVQEVAPEGHALFIRNEVLRKVRQGTLREYLPPSNTQKPRPFEPVSTVDGEGYPPSGFTPQPPFPYPTVPGLDGYPQTNDITSGFPTGAPSTEYPSGGPSTQPAITGYPSGGPSTEPIPTGYPSGPSSQPASTGYPEGPSAAITTEPPYQPSTGFPTSERPGFPTAPPPGYTFPQPGSTEQPETTGYTYTTGRPGFPTAPPPGFPTEQPGYTTGSPGFPTGPPPGFTTSQPGYTTGPSAEYTTLAPQGFTSSSPQPAEGSTEAPTTSPAPFTTIPSHSTEAPGFSTSPPLEETTGVPQGPESTPAFPTHAPVEDLSTSSPVGPTEGPEFPSGPSEGPSDTFGPSTHLPITPAPEGVTPGTTHEEFTAPAETSPAGPTAAVTTESPEVNTIPTGKTPENGDSTSSGSEPDDDLNHPPHIHDIQVDCGKEMMTITIEFNRQFDGVIYSKGYYSNPDCRYVKENSGQTKYTFTVSLNTCGTEFVNAFDTEGKSYLQNVLVIQNEAGIQEVWDVIRSVRCLWEGSLKDTLSVALSVGMLTQEIVTFSGDTAMAKLDIQLGKGPFAPPADGLVKIGETMTLVVSVSGDPGFDLQVKDCRATDSTNENVVPLTDDNGCVLKPKLFGAFQKTRNTGDTGASIIAYAFFSAFKFPDVMDLMIECNIELCKTDCEVCLDPDQKIDPGRRRRRDLSAFNATLGDGVLMGKRLRVILPEDLSDAQAILNLNQNDGVCMSTQNFVFSSALLISLLVTSSFFSAYLWLKNQRLSLKH
ncbi:collagen alpha-1(II) chain isoform X2 [Aethina tumida]|uniref:collagen alpha-1(II) chain isoform X2 n=1 Tax=Aethina tumida TaxID=116153 RepID=UPI002147D251|nr:collagen alpha-1(II) chain isoform X2 [Aethina tumida]